MEVFFMQEYSYFQRIYDINSFNCLTKKWVKGDLNVA